MLISINWIQDFVKLPSLTPKEIANSFTLATAEVEDVKLVGDFLKKVVCVEISSIRPHPQAEKLNLVSFHSGSGEVKEVVCGAPNVKVGLKVPFAPIGTTLPQGFTLEAKKIRGVLSEGMLCSEVELGLGEGGQGLMELDSEAKPGTTMLDYLGEESDILLDIDNKSLTHRPDLWGMLGMAREFAAVFNQELMNPFHATWEKSVEKLFDKSLDQLSNDSSLQQEGPIKIEVEEDSSCLAYYGVSLDIPQMIETPEKIKKRLEIVGLRPINLIVDISNYVMLELGIPNHIFDREKISGGKVFIRKNKKEVPFMTLDDQERILSPHDTVIADEEGPLVIAGLMGGAASGVSPSSRKLFIEVANWAAHEVRTTSVRLGLRTDSSQRFEKSLDSHQCYKTLLRLVELISDLCPGTNVLGKPEIYLKQNNEQKELNFQISHKEITNTLGTSISCDKIKSLFQSLDFSTEVHDDIFHVTVPSYRTTKDISEKVDLIEEVGRLIGYDHIQPSSPLVPVTPVRLSPMKIMHRKIQKFLVQNARMLEVMTYPLVGKELLEKALWPQLNEELVLLNALSNEQDRMRPSLIPSAIEIAHQNQKHFDEFSFFEIGRTYLDYKDEKNHLLVGMFSKKKSRFLELENVMVRLLDLLNVKANFTNISDKFENKLISKNWKGIHPYEYQNIQVMGQFSGIINTVHPLVLKSFKTKGYLSLAVVDLSNIENREIKEKIKYQPISKYPSSFCDFTVVVDENFYVGEVLKSLKKVKAKELKNKSICDVFPLENGQKAVTLRAHLHDNEKTLSAEKIKEVQTQVINALEKSGLKLKS